MPRSPFGLTGVASADLSLSNLLGGLRGNMSLGGLGDALREQVGEETEEERRRKRLGLSATQQTGSLAVQNLFGGAGLGPAR
jgi:hypothetical protein